MARSIFWSSLAPTFHLILSVAFSQKLAFCFSGGEALSPFQLTVRNAPLRYKISHSVQQGTPRRFTVNALTTHSDDNTLKNDMTSSPPDHNATDSLDSLSSNVFGSGAAVVAIEGSLPGVWPCMDALDRSLIKIALPLIANFAINPLIGAVDLFWVSRMGNALAVAGQAAANQVFNSIFWMTSFLPSITATLISKENAKGNQEGVQDAICQALFVGIVFALLSSVLMFLNPAKVLASVLPVGSPALQYAKPYFFIRSLSFLPALISLVGFSAFRGIVDTKTPVKINAFAQVFNAILDPLLIFTFAMGITGGMCILLRYVGLRVASRNSPTNGFFFLP